MQLPEGTAKQTAMDARIDRMSYAIACAEGFFKPGSLPCRIHNPGDMKLGDVGFGIEQEKTVFKKAEHDADLHDHTDGFSALRRECLMMLTGRSHVYTLADTFEDVARKWTGGDNPQAWCAIVVSKLNILESTTLEEFAGLSFASLGPNVVSDPSLGVE